MSPEVLSRVMDPPQIRESDDVIELTERLVKYATGQFDPSLIHTATLPMLSIGKIAPDAFGRCGEYLSTLDLSRNALKCLAGFEHLKALKHLNIAFNGLTAVDELVKCPCLEVLHMEANLVASIDALKCFERSMMPSLRSLHLQTRDQSDANPVCLDREPYVEFTRTYLQHIRCVDGHYFDRFEVHPRYVDGGNDSEVVLPDSAPWIDDGYFGTALLEAAKVGAIPEKAFSSQVAECRKAVKEHTR